MNKVVIIGSPGAGKTTLARTLGRIRNIRVIHLDRLFWKRGWQAVPGDKRIDILQELVQDTRWPDKQWIIEGTYFQSSEPRLEAADTIIFLDIHPLLCLGRVIQRHYTNCGQFRRDLPDECTDRLTFSRMLYILKFSREERRELLETLCNYSATKNIISLYSPKEVRALEEGLSAGQAIEHVISTIEQGRTSETTLLQNIDNIVNALIFFIRSCSAWLIYFLSPKAFFTLRAIFH